MGKYSTFLGIIISIGLIIWSIVASGDIMAYVDIPSVAIVVGGTLGTTLMVFSISKLKSLFKILMIAFLRTDADKVEELYQILELSSKARKAGGILGISQEVENLKDPFLKNGLTLVMDNAFPEAIHDIMAKEIDSTAQRHQNGQDILAFMADAAPAFGKILPS